MSKSLEDVVVFETVAVVVFVVVVLGWGLL